MFEISLLSQFLPGFHQFLKRTPIWSSCISLNIACKFKCYIPKSTLDFSGCNDLYFIAIAFIAFRYMKSNSVQFLGGHPVQWEV